MAAVFDQYYRVAQHSMDMMSLMSQLTMSNIKQLSNTYNSLNQLYEKQISLFKYEDLHSNAIMYATDHVQRSIIFWDIIRKRGNQYIEHVAAGQPPVLIFPYKMLIDGRKLERPVNYALVKIIPPAGIHIDKTKRPYLIVDPRAGHGSGIGGFKDDSQVGVALRSGHPVYFVIFFPEPEPGQTIRDITIAEEQFLKEVAKRHPKSPKPCIIGNCQGGWAVMALAAARPDIAGTVVINGAPLSYWAGENGKNPMRYVGGILCGSWLAQYAGDLGNGKFDGANLVLNFELLNPANTLWNKFYNLFVNVDEEENNFLNFERWWGGFYLMNSKEMRGIVDNLFIGNKLSHGKIPLDKSTNIDLRNIQVPIIIFCSQGDNITPPQQALNWIADIYPDVLQLKLAGQTIVYHVHQSVGHLGIFVSSHVAKKEYRQIVDLLNYVEHMPPGLYEMIIKEDITSDNTTHYTVNLIERSINDLVAHSENHQQKEEGIFNIVRTVSELNATAYDLFVSPYLRPFTNEYSAEVLRELHPLRTSRYLFSDKNPFLLGLSLLVPYIKQNREPIANDNPFLDIQTAYSDVATSVLDNFRELRDSCTEALFYSVYGMLNALLPEDLPFRDVVLEKTIGKGRDDELSQQILATAEVGGVPAAVLRILLLLIKAEGFTKGSNIPLGMNQLLKSPSFAYMPENEFRSLVHTQTVLVEYDSEWALSSLSQLLKSRITRKQTLSIVHTVLSAIETIPEKAQELMHRVERLLDH